MWESLAHAAWIERIGWTLVHSLWQFALVALAAVAIERVLARHAATIRYRVLLVIMCVAVAMPVATWFSLPPVDRSTAVVATDPMDDEEGFSRPRRSVALHMEGRAPSRPPQTTSRPPQAKSPPPERAFSDAILPRDVASPSTPRGPAFSWAIVKTRLAPWLPAIVVVWFAGVLVTALRPLLGWRTVRRLKTVGVSSAGGPVPGMVESLARRFHLARAVEVLQSTLVKTPMVVGYLRPVVLLPLGVVTGLPAAQLEMILAHELAHVRRHDYLFNLLQTLVETLFFYHPAVWWLSRQIRNERENCCDDVAMATVGSRIDYGRALLAVAELRAESPALSVAARGGSLLGRIQRITGCEPAPQVAGGVGILGAILVAVAVGAAVAWGAAGEKKPKPGPPATGTAEPASKTTINAAGEAKAPATKRGVWQPGQVIDFRVLHAKTKEPLPGVRLRIGWWAGGRNPIDESKIQITDAQGRSEIELPDRKPELVQIYPSKAGFVPLLLHWHSEPAPPFLPGTITVSLEPGTACGGIVRNEQGEPIPGVTVNVRYSDGRGNNPFQGVFLKEKVTTDEDGRWRIDTMPSKFGDEGPKVYLTHPHYLSDHLQDSYWPRPVYERPSYQSLRDQTATIVMRKGLTIEGRVTDESGSPIAGATIRQQRECYWEDSPKVETTADADGHFQLPGIDDKNPDMQRGPSSFLPAVRLTVHAPGYAPDMVDASVTGTAPPLAIKLKRGQTAQGRVVDEKGRPVKGVSVTLDYWQGWPRRFFLKTTTDADGRFRIDDAPVDRTEYDFEKRGHITVRRPLPPRAKDYQIVLRPPVEIVGSILDADTGKPLEKCALTKGWDPDGRAPEWETQLGAPAKIITDGRYRIVLNGEQSLIRMRVEAKGYMPAVSRLFKPYDPDRGRVVYDFRLKRAGPMSGVVLDVDGKPLAGAEVYVAKQQFYVKERRAEGNGRRNSRMVKTDANGRFQFPPEVEPFYLVVLHEQGHIVLDEKQFAVTPTVRIGPWTARNETFLIQRKQYNYTEGSAYPDEKETLTVRGVDREGKPVEGANVASSASFRAGYNYVGPNEPAWDYFRNVVSDVDGRARLADQYRIDCVVARHVERGLVAIRPVTPEEVKAQKTITLTLQPQCTVFGTLTSKELAARHRQLGGTGVYVYMDDGSSSPMSCSSDKNDYHFYLPPGSYKLDAYGGDVRHAEKTVTVKPDQRELEVEPIDLPAEGLVLLEGKPAPELRGIVAWKNGAPCKLADLRGKVVMLAFSHRWTNTHGIVPALFPVYEKYHGRGLEIIEIRFDRNQLMDPQDKAKLDERLAEVKEPFWKEGRIPVPIALVGMNLAVSWKPGEKEPSPPRPILDDYGISRFPTIVLIDRQGRIAGRFNPGSKTDTAVLERLLKEGER